MKENKGTKKNLRFIFAAAFIMILAMGTIALTGCEAETAQNRQQSQKSSSIR